jgi:ankyrin repeat protein
LAVKVAEDASYDENEARPESDGSTPLDYAAAYWDLAEVRLLVEHGADVNAKGGPDCGTPAFWAGRRTDVVLYLVDRGSQVNARRCDGGTLLLAAVESRNYELARGLIERGADVKLGTRDGVTPLLIAHIRDEPNDREIATVLRGRGATVNAFEAAKWRAKARVLGWMMGGGGYP